MAGAWMLVEQEVSKFPLVDTDKLLLEGEVNCGSIFLHAEVKCKFTPSVYQEFLEIWDELLEALVELGHIEVFSFIKKDEKIVKWQEMFGMHRLIEFDNHYLYRRIL